MQTITAKFRIVTPMFIAGANQQRAELRAPSIKGALRFWWRALNWPRFFHKAKKDKDEALRLLYVEEARLFGLSADGKRFGQSEFLLSLEIPKPLERLSSEAVHPGFVPKETKRDLNGNIIYRNNEAVLDENSMAGARYLGYGVIVAFSTKNGKKAGQLERERGCISCTRDDQYFILKLRFRKRIDETVVNALKAMGLLGGLGARSRRGMGSLVLEELRGPNGWDSNANGWEKPTTLAGYIGEINNIFDKGMLSQSPMPSYSAFSAESRIDILLQGSSAIDLLNEFGLRMLDYRSWGRTIRKKGRPPKRLPLPSGRPSEERFKNDHDWYRENKRGWRSTHPDFHPRRVVFGLPHNYSKKAIDHVMGAIHERRASPLMIHVHRLSANEFLCVSILLKSDFLSRDEQINAGGRNVDANIDWSVIDDFLDGRVGNPPSAIKRFPDREAVL